MLQKEDNASALSVLSLIPTGFLSKKTNSQEHTGKWQPLELPSPDTWSAISHSSCNLALRHSQNILDNSNLQKP